ncbi:MAG: DUF5329 domain-containing protein [Gammaproteobacteria bacterium]
MVKTWIGMAALMACAGAQAALSPTARIEVQYLLDTVGQSGCKFNRNGSWYDAKAARSHLQTKLEYLEKKDLVTTAESFIERGASTSSSSGKAYQIQCPGSPAVDSAKWFREELKRYRLRTSPGA